MEGRSRAKVPKVPGWGICTWVPSPVWVGNQLTLGPHPGVGRGTSRAIPGARPRAMLVVVRGDCWCLGLGFSQRRLWHSYKGPARRRGSAGWPVEASGHHPWAMTVYENIYISILPSAARVSWLCCSGYGSWVLNERNWENILNNINSNFVSYKIHIESTMNDTTDLSSNSRNQSHLFTSLLNSLCKKSYMKSFPYSAYPAFPDFVR